MKQKKSVLKDSGVLMKFSSLDEVMQHIAESKNVVWKMSYLHHQHSISNVPEQIMFCFDLQDQVIDEFNAFARNYSVAEVGELVFYSWPGCGCNSPATLRWIKMDDWMPKAILKLFEQPRIHKVPRVGFEKVSLALVTDKELVSEVRQIYKRPFKGEKYWYLPFRICDYSLQEIQGRGGSCAGPTDDGYVRRKIEE